MKKSSFVAMMLGTVSGVLFALGMCMTLLPQWNTFKEGVVFGTVGIILGLITLLVWRKMENKATVKLSKRIIILTLIGIAGALTLGIGMCLCMVWENYVIGTIVGLAGILILLALITMVKGIQ